MAPAAEWNTKIAIWQDHLLLYAGRPGSAGFTAYKMTSGEKLAFYACDHEVVALVVSPRGVVFTCAKSGDICRWELISRNFSVVEYGGVVEYGYMADIEGAQWVTEMQALIYYSEYHIHAVNEDGRCRKLEGPTERILGVQWVPEMQALISYGFGGDLHAFDKHGKDRKLEGPTENIKSVQWVPEMQALISYGIDGELHAFDRDGEGRKLEGHTESGKGVEWVPEMQAFISYGDDGYLHAFDRDGKGRKLEGPTKRINRVQWVPEMQALISYGIPDGDLHAFDRDGKGRKLEGPTQRIMGAQWVPDMQALISYGGHFHGEFHAFDKHGKGRKLEGPTKQILGAQWVPEMQALITYGSGGDLHAFDKHGKGRKLEGPTKSIMGAQWVPQMQALISYGIDGELHAFDKDGKGRKLEGPTESINGAQCVPEMQAIISYGGGGDLHAFDKHGKGRKLEGPTKQILGVQWVPEMQALISYGPDGDLHAFDKHGKGRKLEGPTESILGVQWVPEMQALISYGGRFHGELHAFDRDGKGRKLEWPTTNKILGVQWVPEMQALISYNYGGFHAFDKHGKGRKLEGPTKSINGAQWVPEMQALISYGIDGELHAFDSDGKGRKLEGPTRQILGVQWVPEMQALISYGPRGDLHAFDRDGKGRKLEGPTETIMGVQWVPEMQALISYGGGGDLHAFDRGGKGRKLEGPTEQIMGVQWVPDMQALISYGSGCEIFSFDQGGHACEVEPHKVGHGNRTLLKLCKRAALSSRNSRRLHILGHPSGDMMVVQHEAPVQAMTATPDGRGLITLTGASIVEMTYIDVSAYQYGFLGVVSFKGKCSDSILDLPKRYPLQAVIFDFSMKLLFQMLGILQFAAFGVRGVQQMKQLPALTQPAHFLEGMQKLGLDPKSFPNANDQLFCGSVIMILLTVFVFFIQEKFEKNAFFNPMEKYWSVIMDASSFFITIVTGPLFIPLFNTMLWPFQHSPNGHHLIIYRPIGASMALVIAYYSLRFVRVDQMLGKIDANGIGLILWSGDAQATKEERKGKRRHPLSPMSPKHDQLKLAVKIALSIVRILLTEGCPITAGLLRVLIGLVLIAVDLNLDAFYPSQKPVNWNALNFAASVGVTTAYLASFFTVLIYQTHKEDPDDALEAWKTQIIALNLACLPLALGAYYLRKWWLAAPTKAWVSSRAPLPSFREPLLP